MTIDLLSVLKETKHVKSLNMTYLPLKYWFGKDKETPGIEIINRPGVAGAVL